MKEVAESVGVPESTLRYWEREFPMFKPQRTKGGQRRYTKDDCNLCATIKVLLYEKGMKIEAAKDYLSVAYRKYKPRNPYLCRNCTEAVNLLKDVIKMLPDNLHATERIKSVVGWIENKEPES